MMQRMLPDPIVRMTQFYRAKAGLQQFRGSCGQTALAVCMAAAAGTPGDFEGVGELMIALTRDMIAKHIAGPNGAAYLVSYAQEARDWGYTVAIERPYQEPLPDWETILHDHAGQRPILLQVARGEMLVDAETGRADEPGLRYHAFAIVGSDERGYIATDGDNPEVTRRFQIYTAATLAAAQPCGVLVLEMQR